MAWPFAGGVIRFNALNNTLCAHCPVHGSLCRRTKTVNASSRKTGRPVGHLGAWLLAAEHNPDQHTHVHGDANKSFPADVRRDARRRMKEECANSLFALEAAKKDTDLDSEPEEE